MKSEMHMFFFSSRRRHTSLQGDWSSDVCSSDLSPRQAMSVAPNPRGPDQNYQARLTWDDVEWLKKTTRLPVGLKGIMTVRDAKRAVETGVQAIWVSNHGGRQLDHTQATVDALPAIVDAVAGRAEIVVDGGFRRGTDVIKAV